MKSSFSPTVLRWATGILMLVGTAAVSAYDCTGLSEWESAVAYHGGAQVQSEGTAYQANWWSQGKSPAQYSGQWQEWTALGQCDGSSSSGGSSSSSSSGASSSSSSGSSGTSSGSTSSSSSSGGSSGGGDCTSPEFVAGTAYAAGELVQNVGYEYRCDIAGWCSSTSAWAYEPGVGSYWDHAWTEMRSCEGSSSSSGGSSSGSGSSGGSSSSSSGGSSGSNGSRIISGYWHNFDNGSGVIPIADVSDAYNAINVSFAEPTGAAAGEIGFVLDPLFNEQEFIDGIQAKQAAGKKIIISIGGANGQVRLESTLARDNFVSSMIEIIDRYGFDGLDVDFEGHSLELNAGDVDFRNPTTPVIVNLIDALKALKAHYGESFMLTMAPETFFVQLGYSFYGGSCSGCDRRAGAYLPVIHAMRDDLDWLQVQHYNSGAIIGLDDQYHTMGVADFHIAMADMVLTGFNVGGNPDYYFPPLRQDQVLIGLPANVNAGGGFTSVGEVHTALNCLVKLQGCTTYTPHTETGWTGLGGLMTWSINWDKFNNFEFSTEHRVFLDEL